MAEQHHPPATEPNAEANREPEPSVVGHPGPDEGQDATDNHTTEQQPVENSMASHQELHGSQEPQGNPGAEEVPTDATADPPAPHPVVPHIFSTGEQPQGPQADNGNGSDDNDSALGSFISTKSESLTASVYQYRYENGRRYHAARGTAEYNLPNDEREMDRLNLQHHLCKLTLGGELHRAPLRPDIQHALDIGTGTGIWAIDFAEQYLACQVTGTDLSPIQPTAVPTNCQFYVEDFENDWGWGEQKFDYVHTRMLVAAAKDWPKLFRQAYHALKPGGWVECMDFCFPVRCDDESAGPDSDLINWSKTIVEGASKAGVKLDIATKLPQMIRDAGFVEVHIEWYAWPTNRWPKDQKMKEIGKWANMDMREGLESISLGIFTHILGWTKPQLDELLSKVRDELSDRKSHCYCPVGVFYAKKPEAYSDS